MRRFAEVVRNNLTIEPGPFFLGPERLAMVNSKQVPLFALRRRVLFPGILFHCAVAHPDDVHMIRQIIRGQRWLGVLPVYDSEDPGGTPERELAGIVCLARVRRVHWMPDGGMLMDMLGIARARVQAISPRGKHYYSVQHEVLRPNVETDSLPPWLRQAERDISALRGQPGQEPDPYPAGLWLDLLCHFLPIPFEAKLQLLCEPCDLRRCELLAEHKDYWQANRLMHRYLPRLFRSN